MNVPVRVVTAQRSKDVRYHQLHDADGARIQYKKVCSAEGAEVEAEHIVKGWEAGGGAYVTVTDEELAKLDPQKSETIDIQDFVHLEEIDPLYFEKGYWLVPDKGAGKSYRLLVEAMRKSGRVAIARVVMRGKESLVAVRAVGDVLAMETMLHGDELVPQEDLEVAQAAAPGERELDMAEKLIDALTTTFEPEKYPDEHRQRVLAYLESKAEGREVVLPPKAEARRPADLVDALQKSLEAARRKGKAEG
ncbi:MAG: end-binding protein Ku [Thermoplasmata archaeon]|nr:end-binding protein Ku [Thermoplasmata archaeon]